MSINRNKASPEGIEVVVLFNVLLITLIVVVAALWISLIGSIVWSILKSLCLVFGWRL